MKIEGIRSLPDEYAAVQGVGVDSERNVYFADKWLQRITKYDRDGNLILRTEKRELDAGCGPYVVVWIRSDETGPNLGTLSSCGFRTGSRQGVLR